MCGLINGQDHQDAWCLHMIHKIPYFGSSKIMWQPRPASDHQRTVQRENNATAKLAIRQSPSAGLEKTPINKQTNSKNSSYHVPSSAVQVLHCTMRDHTQCSMWWWAREVGHIAVSHHHPPQWTGAISSHHCCPEIALHYNSDNISLISILPIWLIDWVRLNVPPT